MENALLSDFSVRQTGTRYLGRILEVLRGRDGQSQAHLMSLTAFMIRIAGAGLAFLSQVLLARLMGQFEYGIFVFVWVLAVIVGSLSCLGFPTAIIRFVPQYREVGTVDVIRGITLTARLVALLSAGLLGLLGTACLTLFADTIKDYYLVPLFLGAFLLPMIALGDVLDGTARANSWMVQALSPTFLVRPILILTTMVAALLLGFDASAETALAAALIATGITTMGQLIIVDRRLQHRFDKGPRAFQLGYWMRIALPIFLVEGFYYLLTNSDVVMVALYVEPDQVATYFAAAKTIALVHFVFFAVKAGMTPRFAALVAEKDRTELARSAVTAARWTFWSSLLVGAIVLALGPFFLSLFGSGYTTGYSVMAILFAGIAAKAFVGPGEALLMMSGEQKICAMVYFAALIINIAGNLALIPHFGINGAATATMAAMTAEAALLFVIIHRRLGINMNILSKKHTIANSREAR